MKDGRGGKRDVLLTTLAILMGLMAVSNLFKPIGQWVRPESTAGFVFFGQRLEGVTNAILGPAFGLLLAAYARGVWTMRRWALPVAIAYAGYVPVNLVLFAANPPEDAPQNPLFLVVYAAVAIGVSGGGALYLWTRRERLG